MKSNVFANCAFDDKHPDIKSLSEMEVIDLTGSSIDEICIENFPKLQRFRACHCQNLTKCKICNCENLKVIDLSNCMELSHFEFSQLPNLLSIDLSMTNLTELNDTLLPKLESLIISFTPISKLNPNNYPNLLNLDISGTTITNISFILQLKQLQRFRQMSISSEFANNIEYNFNEIFSHLSLSILIAGPGIAICDALPATETQLQVVILEDVDFIKGDQSKIQKRVKYFYDKYSYDVPTVNFQDVKQTWIDSVRLLYGPWGIPACDQLPSEKVTNKKFDLFDSTQFNSEKSIDHMMGAIFGAAIGSILGASTELSDKGVATFSLSTPIDIIWSHLNDDKNSAQLLKGAVSTEIEQLVILMRSISDTFLHDKKEENNFCEEDDQNQLILRNFATSIYQWSCDGIEEHKQGKCLKADTALQNTFRHPMFIIDPLRAAFESCSQFVANGSATIRSAPVAGCFKFWDEDEVMKNAKNFCCVTHYEGRCIACTVILSLLIAENIKNASLSKSLDIESAIEKAFNFCKDDAEEFESEIREFLHADSLDELVIGRGVTDFVLKSTGAAVLELKNGSDFEKALFDIIREGGDTSVNAATVGAVVGSAVGFNKIPKNLLKYVFNGNWIYKEFAKLLEIMGITPPESPFSILSYE